VRVSNYIEIDPEPEVNNEASEIPPLSAPENSGVNRKMSAGSSKSRRSSGTEIKNDGESKESKRFSGTGKKTSGSSKSGSRIPRGTK